MRQCILCFEDSKRMGVAGPQVFFSSLQLNIFVVLYYVG